MLNQIDVEIGEKIRKRRRLVGISQDFLSAALGVTTIELQSFEKGSRRIGARLLQKLCRELNVPASYFLASSLSLPVGGDEERESLLADAAKLNQAFLGLDSPEARKLIIDLTVSLSSNHRRQMAATARAGQTGTPGDEAADASAANDKIINLRRYLASGLRQS